jgi:RNA polymerase sigma factor (sigma-70 family)
VTESYPRSHADKHEPKRLLPAELEECYRQYASGLRVALRMRLKNELDVEDCLSRVFEKLWSQGQMVAPAARRAWLLVVARNEASLLGRQVARRSIESAGNDESVERWGGEAGRGEQPSDTLVPLDRLLLTEQIERLQAAGRGLTHQQAELLRYRFVENLTFREIAERLGIPLGTALSRARAAIVKLRQELDGEA